VPTSRQEGGRSTKGTSDLLVARRYIHCIHCTSHSERVTYFSWIFWCHHFGTEDTTTWAKSASRNYPRSATFPCFVSIASMANKSQPHLRLVRRENLVCSIWSILTFVAWCHISLLGERRTLSSSSTTRLGSCGPTRHEQNIVFLQFSRIGSQWSRIRRIGSWNTYDPIMEESIDQKSSSNTGENATSEENLQLLIVRSKMEL
jgi:hypothetical protein